MNKEILEKEVEKYNQLVQDIQNLTQLVNEKEQQRLVMLGRVQILQENLSLEMGKSIQKDGNASIAKNSDSEILEKKKASKPEKKTK